MALSSAAADASDAQTNVRPASSPREKAARAARVADARRAGEGASRGKGAFTSASSSSPRRNARNASFSFAYVDPESVKRAHARKDSLSLRRHASSHAANEAPPALFSCEAPFPASSKASATNAASERDSSTYDAATKDLKTVALTRPVSASCSEKSKRRRAKLATEARRVATRPAASAFARAHSTHSRAARAWKTASATTSSVSKCAAALRSVASRSAAPVTLFSSPERRASSSAASPSTLRNATAACGSTSPPSSTSASHSRDTLSPGRALAPSLASHPAHSKLGRTHAE